MRPRPPATASVQVRGPRFGPAGPPRLLAGQQRLRGGKPQGCPAGGPWGLQTPPAVRTLTPLVLCSRGTGRGARAAGCGGRESPSPRFPHSSRTWPGQRTGLRNLNPASESSTASPPRTENSDKNKATCAAWAPRPALPGGARDPVPCGGVTAGASRGGWGCGRLSKEFGRHRPRPAALRALTASDRREGLRRRSRLSPPLGAGRASARPSSAGRRSSTCEEGEPLSRGAQTPLWIRRGVPALGDSSFLSAPHPRPAHSSQDKDRTWTAANPRGSGGPLSAQTGSQEL